MARGAEKKRRKAAPRDAPVGLRLGEDLQLEVQARQGARPGSAGAIVKRDLQRYYVLLNEARFGLYFSVPEAEALVQTLWHFDPAAFRYIWAEMESMFRQYGRPSYLPPDFDPVPFIDRLRSLSAWQKMAVLDAIERYYALVIRKYPGEIPIFITDCDLLFIAGLIRETKVSEPLGGVVPARAP